MATTANRPQMPLFAAAPRIAISMGGVDIALAIGINFNLSVDVQPVYSFGQYGPVALEPVFYNLVTGTLQIIRLANAQNRNATGLNSAAVDTLSGQATKNVVHDYSTIPSPSSTDATSANSVLGVAGLSAHLDPKLVSVSSLFDMVISIRVPTDDTAKAIAKNTPDDIKTFFSTGAKYDTLTELKPWIAIRGCRLNARNVNITMGQIVNEPVSFTGIYADSYASDGETSLMAPDDQTKDS
jgi:hypothetical protein